MPRDELATQARIQVETIRRYEALGLWDAAAPDRLARLQRIAVLESLGFSPEQIARAMHTGISIEQLRGMLRYRQCVDPAFDAADLAARIDALEQFEKSPLDSHTT
jgi:DNA-binding transcriptional MerR regulator